MPSVHINPMLRVVAHLGLLYHTRGKTDKDVPLQLLDFMSTDYSR